jgi:biopolymer transport protein ExbD
MTRGKKLLKARAATRALPEEDPEFQIAPMIDILRVLLVFFMTIATDQVLQVNKEVVLPVANSIEKPPNTEQLNVYVNVIWNLDGTGKIEVDTRGQMELAGLTDYIAQKRAAAEGQGKAELFQVIIRGDKRARYSYIKTVMRAVGDAKVPKVIFSAVDKEIPKVPAPAAAP